MKNIFWLIFLMGCGSEFEPMNIDFEATDIKQKIAGSLKIQPFGEDLKDLIATDILNNKNYEIVDKKEGSFLLAVGGVEVCNTQVKVVKLESDEVLFLSHQPEIEPSNENYELPSIESVLGVIEEKIGTQIAYSRHTPCLLEGEVDFSGVLTVYGNIDDMPYKFIADEKQVYEASQQFFSATATVRAFDTNPTSGTLSDYSVSVSDTGYLENNYFKTNVGTGSRAYATDYSFIYNQSQNEFAESSVFAHANFHQDWFREKGFVFTGNTVEISINQTVQGSVNNALFTPSGGTPKIQIGDGDGQTLQNLSLDGDVVSHEYGHAVVFNYLTSTSGESLVMHEGLADFFTFARTNNACLGESICPAGSSLCEVASSCLRTADNSLILGVNTSDKAHLKSQFLSGMLWDLRGNDIPTADLDAIVFKATTLLLDSSGYHDIVLAMLIADETLYASSYCQYIVQEAKDRGLTSAISDLSCASPLPSLASVASAGGGGSSSSSGGGLSCSVSSGAGNPLSMLWFFLPLYIRLRSRRS